MTTRITLETLRAMRTARQPIAMLTCYDHPTAAILEAVGIPVLLVGDSAANTVLGLSSTRDIPPEYLLTITAAVRRGAPNAFVLADMPFAAMASAEAALTMARRFITEAGADAVKVECTREDLPLMKVLLASGLPICAHLGLLPQRVTDPSGYKAQGRTPAEAQRITEDAVSLSQGGAVMLLIEAVPDEVSAAVVSRVNCPVIGCGAGPSCDGHVVVLHDVLGFSARPPRFAEALADAPAVIREGAARYLRDVQTRAYPAARHQYRMKQG